MKPALPASLVALLALLPARAGAQPVHDICNDIGASPATGVSSFGAAGDWLQEAHTDHGVQWGFVYVYALPPGDDLDGYLWFIDHKIGVAHSVGAVPVMTFYQLLHIGEDAGLGGSEPEIVEDVLEDPDLMRSYFENFVLLLEAVTGYDPPVLVHVEPDSWGFMMWAMGVEGNDDATSVTVRVDASGHPDVAGYPDHAGGLGQALLHLRDLHAPDVRLGWHASNFRAGTRPEVVVSFHASMGDWDVLVTEHPHNEADESTWWEPWDEERVQTNLDWFRAVTQGAGVPILLWQQPVGTTDWHLFADPGDWAMLSRFASCGVAGVLFEHLDHGVDDPDDFRASMGDLGAVPPSGSAAGGTAADTRSRLAAYGAAPLAWPEGSPCLAVDPLPDGETPDDGPADASTDPGADPSPDAAADVPGDGDPDTDPDGGCGCTIIR